MNTTMLLSLALMSVNPDPSESAVDNESTQGDASSRPPRRAKTRDRGDQPWIRRWAPERNTTELGVFTGLLFPHPRLELFDAQPDRIDQGFVPLRGVAAEVGGRGGFYFLRSVGVEAEGAIMPTRTSTDQNALLWVVRGQLVGQLPLWSVTPFVLAGVSSLGVRSDQATVGNDVDLGFHYGGGVKVFFNRVVGLRLDIRDTLTARRGVRRGVAHSAEVLLGVTVTLGRQRGKTTAVDSDGDHIRDPHDRCPNTPGVRAHDGCPIPDSDGDRILDPHDHCPDVPGVAAYRGCPIPDTDGDGILDPQDRCVEEPEVENNYQDEDGCPDKVPQEALPFDGLIEGIFFDTGTSNITPDSSPTLDEAVEVLHKYPDLHLEITGHTDSNGTDAFNIGLSLERAEAVKTYLTSQGIQGSRIRTRGLGETRPNSDNNTETGRAKNRRIEFKRIDRD